MSATGIRAIPVANNLKIPDLEFLDYWRPWLKRVFQGAASRLNAECPARRNGNSHKSVTRGGRLMEIQISDFALSPIEDRQPWEDRRQYYAEIIDGTMKASITFR